MVLVNFDGWSDNQKQVYNAASPCIQLLQLVDLQAHRYYRTIKNAYYRCILVRILNFLTFFPQVIRDRANHCVNLISAQTIY